VDRDDALSPSYCGRRLSFFADLPAFLANIATSSIAEGFSLLLHTGPFLSSSTDADVSFVILSLSAQATE